ncbi:SH3 domain-containing protein [Coraliomargarita parva]|uniref:SH3 domain-containing protein n=1 Tax=Coraliomargarita parva TaxID=3014050 RepID=UPI0022B36789|nr:SH3 domain-containing protein [Coraliomargarita parva]
MKYLPALIAFLTCLASLSASNFSEGTAAYEAGDYAGAQSQFEAALVQEETAAGHHNLALSLYQQAQPAEAAWQLERALQLTPYQPEYHFKLAALREQLGLLGTETRWYELAGRALTLNSWLTLLCLSFWIGALALFYPIAGDMKAGLATKGLRAICLISCTLALAGTWLSLQDRHRAICLSNTPASLHAAPATGAPQSGQARPGERLHILERHNDFAKVVTEQGSRGWIAGTDFKEVFPQARQDSGNSN